MYAKNVERRLSNVTKSDLLYKCNACNSTLNVIRFNGEWCARWIETPNMDIVDLISSKDL